jgi:exosortase
MSTTIEFPRAPGLADRALRAWHTPDGRATLIGIVGGLAALGLIYAENLRHFLYAWTTDDNYSHGFLVPLISLYFANRAAQRGPVAVRAGAALGTALLGASMLGRLLTVLMPVPFIGDLTLLLGIAGLCALMAGADALRRYAFAIFFLIFMVPLPIALYTQIASPLQFGVSRVASDVLNLTGLPVLREGNRMTLPGGTQLFVAEACSGMRQLTGFIALTAAVAYLSARPAWYRTLLVASSVPIAMTANTARVVLTGYIMHYNRAYASGTFHTIEGLLMMGFGLSLLRAEGWALDQVVVLLPGAEEPPA